MLTSLRINFMTLALNLFTGIASVFVSGLSTLAFTFAFVLPLLSPLWVMNAQAQVSNYILGANDVIAISVYDEDDLSFEEIRILDSGNITYPFLGEVSAAGNTVNSLEELIRTGLIDGEFLIDPDVTVNIVEYRPFYIDGEVEEPGSYPFEPGLTLRRAISIAGGFTERGARNGITVHGEGAPDADPEVYDSLEVSIKPGDVITIRERFF
jgi:protein involved in polysaccharide export with SLBB domain